MTAQHALGGPNSRFLATDARIVAHSRRPVGGALTVSVIAHGAGLLLIAILASRSLGSPATTGFAHDLLHLTWIPNPAPSGDGSGGSGHRASAPARVLESPGTSALTVPAPPAASSRIIDTPPLQPPLDVPAMATAAGLTEAVGVIASVTLATPASDGPGSGDRQGSGNGPGLGAGDHNGFGPGANGGPGGTGLRPGNGVTAPRLIREVKPGYTSEAMRARIQGVVRLQAIVLPDGSVGSTRIVRSLDPTFGLDQEAEKTVRQWRFQPGTLAGRAVPVLIDVELAFTLR
jgi:periplasmic protein TonB